MLKNVTATSLSDYARFEPITCDRAPYILMGVASRPFLCRLELLFNPTRTSQEPGQTIILEHWVDVCLQIDLSSDSLTPCSWTFQRPNMHARAMNRLSMSNFIKTPSFCRRQLNTLLLMHAFTGRRRRHLTPQFKASLNHRISLSMRQGYCRLRELNIRSLLKVDLAIAQFEQSLTFPCRQCTKTPISSCSQSGRL